MGKKTEQTETMKVWEEFKNYAQFKDLKDLYTRVLPPLRRFEDVMG